MPIGEHFTQKRVEFHETDRVGMAHFSNYFRYMDTAVAEFFRALQLPGPLTRYWGGNEDDEMDWPYVNVSCDFKKPAQFDDLIQIHIWVQRIGNKSLTFGISYQKESEELAVGQVTVVCSKGIRGQPKAIEIPPEIRQRIAVPSWYQAGRSPAQG